LKQFKDLLAEVAGKLTPTHGIKKLGKAITWPYKKGELKDIFTSLERYLLARKQSLQNAY
jgi:hypothetical protein